MCFYRTKLYKACGHSEFRRFMCNPAPTSNTRHPPDLDCDGHVFIKSHVACGGSPQHVNDLELGVCGHCRKARRPNKEVGRRSAILEKKQARVQPSIRILVTESDADEVKHGDKSFQQPVIAIFLPESDAKEAKLDEKTEDFQALPADVIKERRFFKQSVAEAVEECRQFSEEIEADQTKASSLLDAVRSLSDYRPESDKSNPPAIITNERPTKPMSVKTDSIPPPPRHANPPTLSHSVTKVRRELYAAKGRVRSMIDAINTKGDVSQMISPINHRSMVTAVLNTISRNREPSHSAKPEAPVAPKKELTEWPLPPPPHPDTRALSKPAKLQVLAQHHYHRLAPIAEDYDSKCLVVANCPANTVVLRRAKVTRVRNLNAFHCPVMKPRFGLRRKVLAPPVPRHSTPPVAVPCSKFADLGRRRVSDLEWCFVI